MPFISVRALAGTSSVGSKRPDNRRPSLVPVMGVGEGASMSQVPVLPPLGLTGVLSQRILPQSVGFCQMVFVHVSTSSLFFLM